MTVRPHLPLTALCAAVLSFTGGALAQTPDPSAAPRMKAIVYRSYGPPEVLRLEEIEKPVCKEDQVLIKVRAAAVNPLDWHFMTGTPYIVRISGAGLFAPKVPRLGVDLAGEVEAVGRSATRFAPGDEVFGHRFGAFAEYVCAFERHLASKPANMTFEQAASVPVAGITALQGLRDRGRLQPGQKVLVNGASGGVGTFAVQIAKALGAEVTGVCSTRNVELVRSIGADHVIDYTREDFTRGGQQYDVILDMVANHSLWDVRRVLAPHGAYVLVGSTDKGKWLKAVTGSIEAAVLSRFVSQHMSSMLARITKEDLAVLGELMQAGKVTPVIDRRYGLSEVPEALRYVGQGHARGKVVITVGRDDGPAPVGTQVAASSASPLGPALFLVAVAAVVLFAPIVLALVLNRRFQRRNPGKRPYRWGYYLAIQSFVGAVGLGVLFEPGIGTVTAFGVVYALLAWFFARRRHWAWIALTILSFNPVTWIINLVYLRKRWGEDAVGPAMALGR